MDRKTDTHIFKVSFLYCCMLRLLEYLPGAVAAQPLQVLPVGEVSWQQAVLKRDARVNEGCGPTVVVHKEGLKETNEIRVHYFDMFEI